MLKKTVTSYLSPTIFILTFQGLQVDPLHGSLHLLLLYSILGVSLAAQLIKNPPAMQETSIQFLGQEDPLEKE